MALINTYNRYYCGSFWNMTYSPMHLDKLSQFDRSPLIFWVQFNNAVPGPGSNGGGLMSGINFHFLTVPQRRKFINILYRNYRDNSAIPFQVDMGKPIHFNWDHVKAWMPELGIAWRRYFPNRVRSLQQIAVDWNEAEVESDIINTDTQNILSVSPELIQKIYIDSTRRKLYAERQRIAKLNKGKRKK